MSTLLLNDSLFELQHLPKSNQNSLASSFLTIGDQTSVEINNSIFKGSREQAPVIQLFGKSKLKTNNATFFNNTQKMSPCLHASSYQQLEIIDSHFEMNQGFPVSDILIQYSTNPALINGTIFTNDLSGDSIWVEQASLQLDRITISHKLYNPNQTMAKQKAVYCFSCIGLNVTNSLFYDIEADSTISLENTSIQSFSRFRALLKNNTFKQIKFHEDGGAVFISNYKDIMVQDSHFQGIRGQTGRGAGVFIQGQYAHNIILRRNSFVMNRARIGGAFYYDYHRPIVEGNTMSLNEAIDYGQNEAGYPVRLALISQEAAVKFSQDRAVPAQASIDYELIVSGQRSGANMKTFYLAVLDFYGQICTTIESQLYFQAKQLQISKYAPTATMRKDIKSEFGIFNVSNVRVVGQPGIQVLLQINANQAFDLTLPDVRLHASPKSGQVQFTIKVKFALCEPGFYFTANGQCLFCDEFTYSYEPPKSPSSCISCPPKALCFGGTQITPLPTYWRANDRSLNFYSCINPKACIGSSLSSYNPQGNCAIGYRGVLCSQCQSGFTKDSAFHCSKCPQFWQNILILVGLSLLGIIIFVVIIKGSLNSVQSKNNPCAVYFKILISHLQLIYLTSTFDLSWPKQVRHFLIRRSSSFIQRQMPLLISRTVFSLQNAFSKTKVVVFSELVALTAARFYVSLLISLLSPAVLAGITVLIWLIALHKSPDKVWRKSLASIIIILFIIHPSMTNTVFKAFHCTKIENDSRLVQEMDQICWQGSHLYWSIFGSLPGLLLWILGIPAFAWCSMHSRRDQLHHKDVKQKYGFLYKGFKTSAFFWECVIMYKKVGVNFISVFLQSVGTIVQAMVVFVFIAFFMILTSKHQPYLSRKLNQLEFFSLLTLSITFYCGIFFLSARDPSELTFVPGKDYELNEGSKWFFFACIVISNFCFLLLWLVRFCSDLREFTRQRYKRLYLCLFLCKRTELFKLENKIAHTQQVNEEIIQTIEKLENLLKNIKTLYIQKKQIPQKTKLQAYLLRTTLELTKMRASEKKFFLGGSILKESYVGEWKERARGKVPTPPPPSGNQSDASISPQFRLTTNNDCMSIHMVEQAPQRRLVPRTPSAQSRMLKASTQRVSLRSKSGRGSESSLVTRRISFASGANRIFTCQNTLAENIEEDNLDSEQRLHRNFEELVGQGRSTSLSTFNLQSSSSRAGSETPLNILIESPSNQRTERAYSKFKIRPRFQPYEANLEDVSESRSPSLFQPQRQIFDYRMNRSSELINSYSIQQQRTPIRRTQFMPPLQERERPVLRPREKLSRPKLSNFTDNDEKILAEMFESDAEYSLRSHYERSPIPRKQQPNQI